MIQFYQNDVLNITHFGVNFASMMLLISNQALKNLTPT